MAKQQLYERIGKQIVAARNDNATLQNLIAKLEILLAGGDKAASVERELINGGFAPRDPENMDPYGAQNHPLNPEREAKVLGEE